MPFFMNTTKKREKGKSDVVRSWSARLNRLKRAVLIWKGVNKRITPTTTIKNGAHTSLQIFTHQKKIFTICWSSLTTLSKKEVFFQPHRTNPTTNKNDVMILLQHTTQFSPSKLTRTRKTEFRTIYYFWMWTPNFFNQRSDLASRHGPSAFV